jgi:PAS domain S-box-containing protein
VNEGFTKLTGYSWDDALGKTSIDLLTGPDSDPEAINQIRRQLTSHDTLNVEYKMRTKSGSYRWIRVEGQPVFDEQGEFKKYFRIQTDIQAAKEHLAEVETLSLIAKHTDNMVVITDEHDRITWINDAFIRTTGYDLVDAAGETTFVLMAGPDSSQERNEYVARKVAAHEPFRLEVLIYTKEGHSRWCALEARPIFDENGRFTKYFRMFADIQERKDHERLILESQKRLEDIFNTRFEAMCVLSREGTMLQMNDRALELSNSKREDRIGRPAWESTYGPINPHLTEFFKTSIKDASKGVTTSKELTFNGKEGQVMTHRFNFKPVTDALGNVNYIQLEAQDITDKAQAVRQSQYNEQLFNAYMKNSPVPAWITSLNGQIENMNERFLEFIGKDESVIGMNMLDVIDHTYLAQYRQHNEVVIKTQKPLQAIEYALDKDKVVHTFLNTRFPIFEDGKLTRIGGMGMDITSILKAEEERNESIKRFEAVSKATDDMIWEWDVVRDKVTWQGENKRQWDHQLRTGDTMKHFLDFLHKDDRDMVDSSIRRAVKNRNKDRWQAEYRMKGPGGEDFHILDRAVILRDIEGNASRMIGAMQDISDRVNLEKEFVKQQELEHKRTTRMIFDAQEAERSHLAADLHDNVNPLLAAARLHINAAEATTEDPAPYLLQSKALIHEGIEEIRKISHNLSNTLINEIGLEDLVLSTLRKLNPDESLEVHTDFKKLETVKVTTTLKLNVIRIIQEQVHNTLKYAQAKNLYIKIHYRDRAIYLTVQDDGQGFDPKAMRTGIGLSNIKNRAESYNGKMKLSSSPGKGCKLEIQLPLE